MRMMNHVRSAGEKRFVALCSVPYLQPDGKATEETYWSKLDEKTKPFAPVMTCVLHTPLYLALPSSLPFLPGFCPISVLLLQCSP